MVVERLQVWSTSQQIAHGTGRKVLARRGQVVESGVDRVERLLCQPTAGSNLVTGLTWKTFQNSLCLTLPAWIREINR
jgi:hypothetical protein